MQHTLKLSQHLLKKPLSLKTLQFSNYNAFAGMKMKTTQQTILKGRPEVFEQYSRDYFQLKAENPNFLEEQARKEEEKRQQEFQQKLFNLKQNDKNSLNFINVPINNSIIGKTAKVRQVRQHNLQFGNQEGEGKQPHPFIQKVVPRKINPTVTGIRRNIPSTIKKLTPVMKMIRKKHVFDALSICENIGTKPAKYVAYVIKQVLRHSQQKDMDPQRLYVNGNMMGKQQRFKLLYYKAKSQMGIMHKDIVQIKLTLEERPIKDMYKEMLVGKTPPYLAFMLREKLKNEEADYETIRNWSHILTAKGRQQRKLMFKRKVIERKQEYLRYGANVETKVIAEKLLEEEATQWANEYEAKRLEIDQATINRRMAVYKKNEDATGLN